jgi:hypothetical protein
VYRAAMSASRGPTRRQVAAGGLAVTLGGLTGCTDDSPADAADERRSGALPRLRENPDRDLVVASLAVEQRHLDRLRAVRRRHRRLRADLAAPVAVHAAHVELLRGAVDDLPDPEPAPWSVPDTPVSALGALTASARTVWTEQVAVAMRARSGTFARLAAGMAAAAAQQEQVIRELRPRREGAGR